MDGVLVDSGEHHRAAWQALLAELGARVDSPEFWLLTIGRPAHEAVALLLGRELACDEAMQLAERKRDFYRRFARRAAVAVPGVTAFVGSVARSGMACAVATSASRHDAQHVLDTLALAGHFGAVVTAEDVTGQAGPRGLPEGSRRDRHRSTRLPRVRGRGGRRAGGAARGHAGHRGRHRPFQRRARHGGSRARHRQFRGADVADVSSPAFWQDLYERGGDGWETGAPAPRELRRRHATDARPRRGDRVRAWTRCALPGPARIRRRGIRLLAGRPP